jgi:membrane protease YdiL (CAAX protease family)
VSERARDGKKLGWKDVLLIVGVVFYVVAAFFVGALLARVGFFLIFGQGWSGDTVKLLSSQVVADILAVILVVVVPGKVFKKLQLKKQELGIKGGVMWRDIGLAIVGFVAYMAVWIAVGMLMTAVPWFDVNEAQDLGFAGLFGTAERLAGFVVLVVLVPIFEEVLFRGWMFGMLRKKLGFWLTAILVSLAFAMLHGQVNVGVNVFIMSMMMCFLREKTGTIYAAIILHSLKNLLAFWVVFVMRMG